ncbi:MAG: hypothetical protein IME95_01720, partial [Proteobacteria bacterium]|nr:hypothetical protein [Pseudomonadota bacterium]
MQKDKSKDMHFDYNSFKRARYFHGMLMTDMDFDVEQIYHNEKRKLLNRMLHGWGVVCGLEVKPTEPTSQCVIVEHGLALDCHGNEILVCEEQTIVLSVKPCASTRAKQQADPCAKYKRDVQEFTTLYVVIKYHESANHPVSVYTPGGSCEEKTCDYSRTQEGFCIEVLDSPPPMPPLETLPSGEACMEPFPCPSSNCCPDSHHILLATISCGPRFDGSFGNLVTKKDKSAEIRYWVERTFDKVCIRRENSGTDQDIITVKGSYEFDSEESIDYNSIQWEIKWDELPLPIGVEIKKAREEKENRKFLVEYTIEAKTNAKTGTADIEVPVTLKYNRYVGDQPEEITWDQDDLPALESPIEIGTIDVRRGNTISGATIRNVEYRKFVATFQWFAWLSEVLGDEYYPWSGDVSVPCAAAEEEICATRRKNTIVGKINRRVAKIREDLV